MLIDDVIIRVCAGHGGKGAVAFNKNVKSLGPTGGRGGYGGSVYAEGVSDLSALGRFRFEKIIRAEDGKEGRGQFRDGANAKDITICVPVGTVIHNLTTGTDEEVTHRGERVLLAKGGFGGKGNFHFRSAKDTSPVRFQPGLPGEEFQFRLELKYIADVGFVGFPNTGKSSLLNELTRAHAEVANYAFTTLEPNLGVYYELILADIPGLIEDSSEGKGLGIQFLRHIERTRILFHCISAESNDVAKDYYTIRTELGRYNPHLLTKPEYCFLTKSDTVTSEECERKLAALRVINPNSIAISIYNLDSMIAVQKILNTITHEYYVKK
ncbi:MAG: GTPase ObgE [Patescibacteria group bacterium]|nr:GTPase ObgE [Patescibacteria group bacterium]